MERYLTVAELSEITGIPRRTIYCALERHELRYIAPNGCRRGWRIAESEMMRWLKAQER